MSANLKEQGIKAFFWSFFGNIAMQGTSFIVSIFLARLLNPSDFALIVIIMLIVGIANIFSDIGLSGALIQRRKVLHIHYSSVFYFNIIITFMLSILTFLSAYFIFKFIERKDTQYGRSFINKKFPISKKISNA